MVNVKKKSVKSGKFVDTEHVNSLVRNYKKERWVHNSERLGKEDSLSVWYSLEELEEFLAKAKKHGSDGIRLYFGAYDQDHPGVYAGRQTVVFVATRDKETETGSVRKDVYINNEMGSSILAYNFGSVCPPFCTTDDPPGITILDKGKDGFVIV